jgi:FixJ family two-component response regulator
VAETPTVYVVEDDPALGSYLCDLLVSAGLNCVVHERGEAFLASYRPGSPECLLVDLRLPDIDGIELQRRLRERGATLPAVFMTGFGTTEDAVRAMKMGAFDFLEKPLQPQAVLDVVRAALEEDRKSEERRRSLAGLRERFSRLTRREREVLDYVIQGLSSREIADRLVLSKKTVDLHRSHVMSKVGAGSIVNLVKMALLYRPIAPPPIPSEEPPPEGPPPEGPPPEGPPTGEQRREAGTSRES